MRGRTGRVRGRTRRTCADEPDRFGRRPRVPVVDAVRSESTDRTTGTLGPGRTAAPRHRPGGGGAYGSTNVQHALVPHASPRTPGRVPTRRRGLGRVRIRRGRAIGDHVSMSNGKRARTEREPSANRVCVECEPSACRVRPDSETTSRRYRAESEPIPTTIEQYQIEIALCELRRLRGSLSFDDPRHFRWHIQAHDRGSPNIGPETSCSHPVGGVTDEHPARAARFIPARMP